MTVLEAVLDAELVLPYMAVLFLFTSFIRIHWYTVPPHLPVYCMGRWVRLHCFFSNGNIKYDTTFYALILIGGSHYFTSYCNESGHICET